MKTPSLPVLLEQSAWARGAAIAAPFLLVAAALTGLAKPFPTFHGEDETMFHFPVIMAFQAQLPVPDLSDYNSATGPLFHLLFAVLASLSGWDIEGLRLFNVVLSGLAVVVFLRIVSHYTARRGEALLWALLFALSPYFFGASFRLLTNNLGILFCLLALAALLKSWESPKLGHWIQFCVWACAATLTRQIYVWLALGALAALWINRPPLPLAVSRHTLVAIALAPLLALVALWNGLTPPSFQDIHVEDSVFNPRGACFALAVMGLYWILLAPDRIVAVLRDSRFASRAWLLAAVAGGWLCLYLVPLASTGMDDGILWRLARATPTVAGSGPIFLLLVPVGLLFIADTLRHGGPQGARLMVMTASFVACTMANSFVHQKYYDPFLMIFVLLASFSTRAQPRLVKFTMPAALLGFALYPVVSVALS